MKTSKLLVWSMLVLVALAANPMAANACGGSSSSMDEVADTAK